jgi:hypothetical protein
MANKAVNIYERVKVQGKWTDCSVPIPKLKVDGTLYLKDDREGKFHISWYEGKARNGIQRRASPSAMPLESKPTKNGSSRTKIGQVCKTRLSQTLAYLFQLPSTAISTP